jgi:choline dehydrogenase-like flavoprotein
VLEEGQYYDRRHFNGNLTELIPKLYRAWGGTVALGSTAIPVPVGRSVGGTTTINSGTCLRTPVRVLREWEQMGLRDFNPEALAPYFEEVESILSVQTADADAVGPIAEVIAKGAKALGFTQYHPLTRNAKGCDGQGLCQFGCPTDAKQSTNVSFIPRALSAGALLVTGARATELTRDGNRITGVVAEGTDAQGQPCRLQVRAGQVVVAMGSLFTPLFLKANGVRNAWLGRNLSIHPAGAVLGYYPGMDFRNTRSIPQGYGIADWSDRDIMFEGGTPPFAAHGLLSPLQGREFVAFAERYQEMAYFGFMIRDQSRGRVFRGPHPDVPLLRYSMNQRDFGLFVEGIRTLARLHLAAGAESVQLGGLKHFPAIRNEQELQAALSRSLRPRHFAISAYHPLGTARIAANPGNGVCDSDHLVYGTQGLYVMDGSAVPSSLGANPQVTIMTLAMRAARRLAQQILDRY